MLNPALTEELVKGKGNKYSIFLYCCSHNTRAYFTKAGHACGMNIKRALFGRIGAIQI